MNSVGNPFYLAKRRKLALNFVEGTHDFRPVEIQLQKSELFSVRPKTRKIVIARRFLPKQSPN
ncbi:hypothetical protein JXJ21_11845, partial [candidate division KSB1 bacterium]|nr:hypothetical protein [candidate division KSB1 bacterium]